jgi:hypothetical protein
VLSSLRLPLHQMPVMSQTAATSSSLGGRQLFMCPLASVQCLHLYIAGYIPVYSRREKPWQAEFTLIVNRYGRKQWKCSMPLKRYG